MKFNKDEFLKILRSQAIQYRTLSKQSNEMQKIAYYSIKQNTFEEIISIVEAFDKKEEDQFNYED